jgi:hypothetical protein
MNTPVRKHAKGPGVAFLAVGVALLAVAMSTDQSPLIGVGAAFLVLGAVFLSRSRRAG